MGLITLRSARTNVEMTVIQVAELLGVSRQTIYDWESHKTSPTVDKALALSRLYNVSIYDIEW